MSGLNQIPFEPKFEFSSNFLGLSARFIELTNFVGMSACPKDVLNSVFSGTCHIHTIPAETHVNVCASLRVLTGGLH